MKNETNQPKKARLKGFYTALLISLAMIGAACAYAYQATSNTLEENLNSLQNSLTEETQTSIQMTEPTEAQTEASHEAYDAVAGLQTELPTEVTEEVTEMEEPSSEETESGTDAAAEGEFAHVLVMPLEGEIQAEFSDGELVKSETTGTWQTHNGVDIAAEEGASVCAIDNGTVSDVTKDALWGICVTIDHGNGVISRYCGLSASLSVKNGDTVESGQTIGAVGNTADMESKQASHLHLEVLKNNIYVDPIGYING